MRKNVFSYKASRIPAVLGVCPDDAKFLQWLNEADESLLHGGLWWSTYAKFRICADNGCITLPPQLAGIEVAAQCGVPIPVHDQWFEFMENGWGTRNSNLNNCAGATGSGCACGTNFGCGLQEADHRGYYPAFSEIRGGTSSHPKKITFICDVTADVGATVTVMGYDGNGNWIRTNPGTWQDGETIALAQSPGTTSSSIFSSVTAIRFTAPRKGQVWLYEYDTVATTQRLIGHYQYFETMPSYPRYFIPSICNTSSGSNSCNSTLIEIIAKLDHLPLVLDSDYPVIQSEPAMKLEMMSKLKFERAVSTADYSEALAFHTSAIAALESQLDHYLGSGRRMGLNIVGDTLARNSPIETLW